MKEEKTTSDLHATQTPKRLGGPAKSWQLSLLPLRVTGGHPSMNLPPPVTYRMGLFTPSSLKIWTW
jgi:hypothetical protein